MEMFFFFKETRTKCFTDSKVALFRIRGLEKEWKQFIQNRVNEIRKLVPGECWDHCPDPSGSRVEWLLSIVLKSC